MARVIPADRPRALIEAATQVFIADGYRRAQMEDVARALGVAKGTLYSYVASKAALFDACARYADRDDAPAVEEMPLPEPEPGATLAHLQALLVRETEDLRLLRALARKRRPRDVPEELREVVADLYDRQRRNRWIIKLVDRCAKDFPELATLWFGSARYANVDLLADYIAKRGLAAGTSSQVAARFALETIAFWAVHRHWDPAPREHEEEDTRASVVSLIVRALTSTAGVSP